MLDITFIRENAQEVQRAAHAKRMDVSVADLLAVDEKRRRLLKRVEELRSERNRATQEIAAEVAKGRASAESVKSAKEDAGAGAASGGVQVRASVGTASGAETAGPDAGDGAAGLSLADRVDRLKELVRQINSVLADLETEYTAVDMQFRDMMLRIPNIVSPDTPVGESDADNVEIKRIGEIPTFTFPARSHVEIMESLDMLDVARGVKVSGSRGYFLKNAGLRLHRAVQQLAVDLLEEQGFTVMDVPLMVREEVMQGAGFFPSGRDQTYELPHDDRWLVGTSEGSLVSYYANEVVDLHGARHGDLHGDGAIRLAAVSNCFRREAGGAGRDVRGLYRVHQFAKVEQVILCEADVDVSMRMFEEITKNAEDLLHLLELPYRIVSVCTGDLSQKNYKQVDIETWMPSRESYGETHSSSVLLDFQARRCNIRYRDTDGRLRHCHTLNNTAVASPRILIPLMEVHQREDGTVHIPQALRKYMNGATELRP